VSCVYEVNCYWKEGEKLGCVLRKHMKKLSNIYFYKTLFIHQNTRNSMADIPSNLSLHFRSYSKGIEQHTFSLHHLLPSLSIFHLKKLIHDRTGISSTLLRLFWMGSEIESEEKTLQDLRFSSNAIVYIAIGEKPPRPKEQPAFGRLSVLGLSRITFFFFLFSFHSWFLVEKTWRVERFNGGKVVLDQVKCSQAVRVFKCYRSQIVMQHKVNHINLVDCHDTIFYIKGAISGVEMTRCTNVTIFEHFSSSVPVIQIDICANLELYLSEKTISQAKFGTHNFSKFFLPFS